jgi:hypothetical protein
MAIHHQFQERSNRGRCGHLGGDAAEITPNMPDIPKHPGKSAGDIAQGLVKAVVSAAPVVGGPAAELIGIVFGPPLEKRRDEWMDVTFAGRLLNGENFNLNCR